MSSNQTVGRLWVHMADNEWSSHENGQIMLNLAKHYAAQLNNMRPLIVTVHEHGGWWLCYLFCEGYPEGLIVGTANDAAHLSADALRFGEEYKNAKSEHLGTIRRDD